MSKLINLKVLDLWNNEIDSLPKSSEQLSKLQELILGDNIFIQVPKAVANMPALTLLDLSHNQIGSIQSTDFEKLTKLRILDLSHNGLSVFPIDSEVLPSLTKLSLAGNVLRKISDTLLTFSNLTFLDLSYTELDTVYASIDSFKNLTELYLNDNKLTNLPPEIKNLQELKLLDLSKNYIKIEARDSISGWLPKCEIIFEKNQ